MTLAEIEQSEKEFLIPKDVAPLIGCAPYTINLCARDAPEKLGFPVTLMGSRVRIPRIAFLRYIKGLQSTQDITDCDITHF